MKRDGSGNTPAALGRPVRAAADPRGRLCRGRRAGGQCALPVGPVRSGAARVRGGGERAARSVRDRVQSRQCAVQESRPGAGARPLSRRARDRRSGAGQPRQVQHWRDQVSPALAAAQRREDARPWRRRRSAISGQPPLDPDHADARYNLELAHRFHYRLEQDLLHAQRNAASPEDKTPRRGQALSDKIRNEGSGRDARPDMDRRLHGQRANEVPENYSNNEETSKLPEMARLPVAMSLMARSSSWSSCASA